MEKTLSSGKKRIFIAIQYFEIGGAERSLIGLLNAIDYARCEVDLFVYRHTGEFMNFIPPEVHLLPEIKKYTTLSRPIKEIVKEGYWDIALGRLWAHIQSRCFEKRTRIKESIAVFQYVASYTTQYLPSLDKCGEYDLAISFLIPHNIVRDKVRAKQKWAWIHTDYSFVGVDIKTELPIWAAFDRIISISEAVSKGFLSKFPSLNSKLLLIENILSEKMVREHSCVEIDANIFCGRDMKLCTVGRFSYPKAIDRAVLICKKIVDSGMDIIWYVVGYGGDEGLIRKVISENGMERHFILLGKQMNPYPYIKACDIYVQPSRYEGKAVTVREAQILEKPVVITNFPTASSQLVDGVDGIIVPNDVDGAAKGLMAFIKDVNKRNEIITYLHTHHYGNEEEVNKIYQMLEEC
ncbi:glycosyltransferase [uncultured Bacteroides sp.]|jgi:glycosyltransferase involved in cell wall biosynthesis|uniref:glycosyltransferase n=1 Tax=uncultured Bacteroides sp. TaxID=162156 RepID=UPI0025858E28|nr:glycosyltransferase [uncultured Bacteroides sp.]